MVDEDHYQRAVNGAFHLLEAGDSYQTMVDFLRAQGLTRSECARALRTVADVDSEVAEHLVNLGDWPEADEGDPYWYMDAVNLLEDTFELAVRAARQSRDPATELGNLRAHLAFALDLVREEQAADGRVVIIIPTDTKIIEEVERLGGSRLPQNGEGQTTDPP